MMSNELNVKLFSQELQDRLASGFKCGNPHIDEFIKSPISLDDSYGKTFVYLSDNNDCIIGFYNLGTGYIEEIKDRYRYKIGGAVHINEFALDSRFHSIFIRYDENGQKINLSDVLLNECIHRIRNIRSEHLGYSFITLCSTEAGYNLYKRRDFEELDEALDFSIENTEEKCTQMYLWLDEF